MSYIEEHIQYWIDYDGTSEKYRKENDLDCILSNGNLNADTIITLWLPLRYVLDLEGSEKWIKAKAKENKKMKLKTNKKFIKELKEDLNSFIPNKELRLKLEKLFELGRSKANVMILPYRKWNSLRGKAPYYDYLPHFLYDLLKTEDELFLRAIYNWINREKLTVFFDGDIKKENIKDLAGTGNVWSHKPQKINTILLIDNYIELLSKRQKIIE